MKKIFFSFIGLFTLLWVIDVYLFPFQEGDALWQLRSYLLYYTGVMSFSLMGLIMILSTRPIWAERWVGGMDQVYRLHKWSGILAVVLAVSHWLIKLSKPLVVYFVGSINRTEKIALLPLLAEYKSLAKSMGEWAVYALIFMLILTLWKSFPYKIWRYVHKIMPILFLMVLFHALVLMPLAYWYQPLGFALLFLMAMGVYAAFSVLAGRIGYKHRYQARVIESHVDQSQVLLLRAQMDASWPGHEPGQFAFLSFDKREGAHPFTIASASHADGHIDFRIKALGDYTKQMVQSIKPNMLFELEGPYGQFVLSQVNPQHRQLWVAGGIGITPFIAWLESLVMQPQAISAQLHYCLNQAEDSDSLTYLKQLVDQLPNIDLHIYDGAEKQFLTADLLLANQSKEAQFELWFCGPTGLLEALEQGLGSQLSSSQLTVHNEAFEMR